MTRFRFAIIVLAFVMAHLQHTPTALGISCANGGATTEVCIDNTNGPNSASITISGTAVGSTLTCSSGTASTYSRSVTVNAGQSPCFTVPNNGDLLNTGVYIHKIEVSGGQLQHQRVPVIYSTGTLSRVQWTYVPSSNVITVTNSGDGAGTCPHASNCTLRTAVSTANGLSGSAPALIQLAAAISGVTMSGSTALSITRNRITIDGTDSNGNPWIVGDANAAAASTQSPFPRSVDLNNATQFSVSSNDNTIKGLHIKNSHTSGTNQAKDLFVFSGLRNFIHAVRIDEIPAPRGNALVREAIAIHW